MSHQLNHIATFTTKSGKQASIRSIERDDAKDTADFMNNLSQEDTFIMLAGEEVPLEEEQRYIDSELELIGTENAVKLVCYVEDQLAGIADVRRITNARSRKLHIGRLGVMIHKDFRGQGIGEELLRVTIGKATISIPGLRQIDLECFASNEAALSLYKKLGFKEVARIPNALYRQGEYDDEVIMVLEV